jgi:hypothetical protein
MKLFPLTVLILCFFISLPLTAQNWTAEEQEVLDQIKKGWASWEEAVKAKDLNIWLENVQPADDWSGWWTSDGGLWTLETDKRTFDDRMKNVNKVYWEGLQPLSIKIYDNVALAYFYSTYNVEDSTGKTTRYEDKRFEVYRKVDGIWRVTGTMVSGKEIGFYAEDDE